MEEHDLDFPPSEVEALGRQVLQYICAHNSTLSQQPSISKSYSSEVYASMREPIPENPVDITTLLKPLFGSYIQDGTIPGHPGHFAYVPGGGTFPAALADLISGSVNRFSGNWACAPSLCQLERNALRWLSDWIGYPQESAGLFTTGGSMANFNAIFCAREAKLGYETRLGCLYVSSQVHHSVNKSAKLAAIFPDRIRMIAVDAAYRMDVVKLQEAIEADVAAGLVPFCVVSTCGTTNTGAIDPLQHITTICQKYNLWHHVDGAYGALFGVCDELRDQLRWLAKADSVTVDPHKGLFLPYGTGCLLVRNGTLLRSAHSESAAYLPDQPDPTQFYDPHMHGPDLSRGNPGLRVWMTVKMYGARKLAACIREKRQLAVYACEQFRNIPGIVIIAEPQLSLFAYQLRWPGASAEQRSTATKQLLQRVNDRGRVMLSGCVVAGEYIGRMCVLTFRAHRVNVDMCVEDVRTEAACLLLENGATIAE